MTVRAQRRPVLTGQADEWFNKSLETRKKNAEKKKGVVVGSDAGK